MDQAEAEEMQRQRRMISDKLAENPGFQDIYTAITAGAPTASTREETVCLTDCGVC
jgi:hypothetical protein